MDEEMLIPMVKILKLSLGNLISNVSMSKIVFWPDTHFSTVNPRIR